MFCNCIASHSMSCHCPVCVRLSHSIKDYLLTYLLTYVRQWMDGPMAGVVPDVVEQEVGNFWRTLFRLEKAFVGVRPAKKIAARVIDDVTYQLMQNSSLLGYYYAYMLLLLVHVCMYYDTFILSHSRKLLTLLIFCLFIGKLYIKVWVSSIVVCLQHCRT